MICQAIQLLVMECPFNLCSTTERPECNRPEYNNPFLRAEDVCINALRQKINDLSIESETREHPGGHGGALQLIELGLNTPDPAEATAAFDQAAAQLATFTRHPSPDPRLHAARDLSYIPLFKLRRRGLPSAEIAPIAYKVLGKSLHEVCSHTTMSDSGGEIIIAALKGLLAENSVAALLASAGYAIFPSSNREGGNADPSLNSDFQIIEHNRKLPVEIKFRRVKGIEYDSRIKVIRLSDICRVVVEDFYPQNSPPSMEIMALEIARLIAGHALGRPLSGRQKEMLKKATLTAVGILKAE